MPFDAQKILLTNLLEIELPATTIRLCDGGFVYVGADKFSSSDVLFGSIGSAEAISESAGDEAPAIRLSFLSPKTVASSDLSQAAFQGSRVTFWLAEVNEQTGVVTGTPELIALGEIDTTTLKIGRGIRAVDVEVVSVAERLFNINEGNVLSPRFHKSVWPGELGMDNATGVGTVEAWGTESPPRGSNVSGSGGSAGGYQGMTLV